MTAITLRKEVQQYISHADELFLKMVHAMGKEYERNITVGYSTKGEVITKEDLKKRVKAASNRVKSGDFITQEELEKEVENW